MDHGIGCQMWGAIEEKESKCIVGSSAIGNMDGFVVGDTELLH